MNKTESSTVLYYQLDQLDFLSLFNIQATEWSDTQVQMKT